MTRRNWIMLAALAVGTVSACSASDGGGHGNSGTTGSTSDGALRVPLDDYAAEINRSINVRCGQCWKELGHMSEQACRDEAKTDVLGDTQRSCFDMLAKTQAADVMVYLQCRTLTARFYDDCFSKSCDLRACAVAYAGFNPPAECMSEDDGGAEPSSSAAQCDPVKSDL